MENNPIGNILKERRTAQGLSIRDVDEKSGIASQKIFRIETGRIRPSKNDLIAIGGALGISEEEVMHLAGYDDGVLLLYKDFPSLQFEEESLILRSIPHMNEMLYDTDPEELKKIAKMFIDFAEKKKGSNKLGI